MALSIDRKYLALLIGSLAAMAVAPGCVADTASPEDEDVASTQEALVSPGWGYQLVNSTGAPWAGYGFNSSSGSISSSRSLTGVYSVSFAGLGATFPDIESGGNVQVVAYGPNSHRCKVSSWTGNGSGTLSVGVACHTYSGSPVDSAFVVFFNRQAGASWTGAYLWNDHPSTAGTTTPSPSYQWSSSGSSSTIYRGSTGTYSIQLTGITTTGGNLQVTAYGTDGAYCKSTGWGGSPIVAGVACFTAAGAPVDTNFSAAFNVSTPAHGRDAGYAYADQPTSSSYTPATSYAKITNTWGTITAGRGLTGVYWMTYPNLSPTGSIPLITAHGTDAAYCKIANWQSAGTGTTVNSTCFASNGAPVDTYYSSEYLTSLVTPP